MHHIHLTKAFVISSFPFSEAGKILNLVTKDLGVIRVNAQATRKSDSKLRQSIQDYSLCEVALVYGKKGWILTNAKIFKNVFYDFQNSDDLDVSTKEKVSVVTRIFSLIERMIPFEHLEDQGSFGFDVLNDLIEKIKTANAENVKDFEIQTVFKIMKFLGYVGDSDLDLEKIEKDLDYVKKSRKKIVKIINNAIKESHL